MSNSYDFQSDFYYIENCLTLGLLFLILRNFATEFIIYYFTARMQEIISKEVLNQVYLRM